MTSTDAPATPQPPSEAGSRLWPLYVGGLLGPFGGAMVSPMIPEVATDLGTSQHLVAQALTIYLVPFAVVMLFSGTLAERWGRRRTVLWGFAAYAASSVICAVAPNIESFLAARAVQGVSNAFTTPVLVAIISATVSAQKLGSSLGWFGSWQSAGMAFAPLVAGLATVADWRLAFAMIAATALLVMVMVAKNYASAPAREVNAVHPDRPGGSMRALANRALVITCALAFVAYFTAVAMTMLGALLAAHRFALGPDARGLLLALFGIAGLLAGNALGRWMSRIGAHRFAIQTFAALGISALIAAFAAHWWMLGVALFLAGMGSTSSRMVTNLLALRSTPSNQAGASSMSLSWMFLGGTLPPVLLVPYVDAHPTGVMVLAAIPALVVAVVLATNYSVAHNNSRQDTTAPANPIQG